MRYQAGIVLPGYNALKVANAPTIGTATVASGTSVSVAFTAPACTGGGAISSYTTYCTTTGTNRTSGSSSPLVVTGLTSGTAYTFKVIATNAYGPSYPSATSNSVTPPLAGSQSYGSAGTYSWVAPAGVTSISVVAVGGGGGANVYGGGGGGGLGYKNNYSVTPGSSYSVKVGAKGNRGGCGSTVTDGGQSYFVASGTVAGNGGVKGSNSGGGTISAGGTYVGDGGGNGGAGRSYGGGGAAGYSGNGGNGGYLNSNPEAIGQAGSGGGGGGGSPSSTGGAGSSGGGGVGICQGQGTSGGTSPINGQGKSGSGGTYGGGGDRSYNCCTGQVTSSGGYGGLYGGGGGPSQGGGCLLYPGCGGNGAVRIIWPGNTRSFPSTCTGSP